jgi:uncharacterized coiled-coil DUF342 family protein
MAGDGKDCRKAVLSEERIVRLEELLEQTQKTITETTGLLKRLHELRSSRSNSRASGGKLMRSLRGRRQRSANSMRSLGGKPRRSGRCNAWPSPKFC